MKNQTLITEREWASSEYHGHAPAHHENNVEVNIEGGTNRYTEVLTQSARHEFLYNPGF